MGTKIYDLVEKQEIDLNCLTHKVIAIDSFLFLYQFLATIRQSDGRPLTDSRGQVTSHLVGLFSRTVHFLSLGIRPAFVFDGEPPHLKKAVREHRKMLKAQAQAHYDKAVTLGNEAAMKKYGARIGSITPEMVTEAQQLLHALGVPLILAPSEGEAQAAYLVKKGDAYAVGSNDADALLFGAKRIVKNLSAGGRKKKPGTLISEQVSVELIDLEKTLQHLGLSHEQLIFLAMLVGTDYNPGGIKGIGPKKALGLVKKFPRGDELFSSVAWNFPYPWQEVYETIIHIPVTDKYHLHWAIPSIKEVVGLLCQKHDFSQERVGKSLALLHRPQATLRGFFS